MTWDEALELTATSLRAYALKYRHWAIAFSGGKDSTATLTAVMHLLINGRVPWPESLTVLYADTRMELPPLHATAMTILEQLKRFPVKTQVVYPAMDDRFFVYMLGRGVPPPSNTFRWCTPQLKIEPMVNALKALRDEAGEKFLMLTGVRVGESAARDARIAVSCGKNGAECGQGWFQESTPEAVADTPAPILHWRLCMVWDWLVEKRDGFSTYLVAESYGGDEAQEINARTGCVACNLASVDLALNTLILNPKWSHLTPLKELRALYAEMKKPANRLRKDGTEKRQDGSLVSNPCRMGPLTFEARRWALSVVLDIQQRARVDIINAEEQARILELIEAKTWPRGWDGTEPLANIPFDNVNPDGSIQPIMHALMA